MMLTQLILILACCSPQQWEYAWDWAVATTTPAVEQSTVVKTVRYETRQVTKYRMVRVKRCINGRCYYTLERRPYMVTEQVPVEQSPIPVSEAEEYATPRDVAVRILNYLRIQPNETFLDVGSGDGRICIAAAQRYGCRAIGIEHDHNRIALARANAERAGVSDLVTFIEGDFNTIDWPQADVGYAYLFPDDLKPIRDKLLRLDRFATFAHKVPNLEMHNVQNEFYVWDFDKVFAWWGGGPYYGRKCSLTNCSMCASIIANINEQKSHRLEALQNRSQ